MTTIPATARAPHWLKITLLLAVIALVFLADTALNLEIAVAMLYALVILAASHTLGPRTVLLLGGGCALLTVLSFWLTPRGARHAGLINTGLSLAAIAMTTYLLLNMAAARASAQAAQLQLLRMARIQNLGGLTTSIAHELNQPLAAMATSADAARRWLERSPPDMEKAQQALARIREDSERASAIIARVRRLTKGGAPQKSAFAFNTAIGEMLALSEGAMQRHGITLHTQFAADLPDAWGDRVQIQQVIANLLLNAIEAMKLPGITKRTLHVTSAQQATMLVACVIDSGAGIAPPQRAQVFDAFWTDKPGGIGLGLSISRAIIEAHGGRISLQTAPQGGTLFQFSVPIANPGKV